MHSGFKFSCAVNVWPFWSLGRWQWISAEQCNLWNVMVVVIPEGAHISAFSPARQPRCRTWTTTIVLCWHSAWLQGPARSLATTQGCVQVFSYMHQYMHWLGNWQLRYGGNTVVDQLRFISWRHWSSDDAAARWLITLSGLENHSRPFQLQNAPIIGCSQRSMPGICRGIALGVRSAVRK